jgi:hypothetical protein
MSAWLQAVLLAFLLALSPGFAFSPAAAKDVAVNDAAPKADALKDGTDLAGIYEAQVDRRLNVPEAERSYYADLLSKELSGTILDNRAQYVVLVDRNANVQALMIYWRDPEGSFHFIGASPVATGVPGQYDHFLTPLGVFDHSIENLDFRAEGTFNELGIRGYGLKGMRVYDFGWQKGTRAWGKGGESMMRLQMHATDPDRLEPLLGVRHSKGCIRIPASLNTFIDHYGLLDADYERAIAAGETFESFWMLSPSREATPWSGRYLVIVDSNRPSRPEWAKRVILSIRAVSR